MSKPHLVLPMGGAGSRFFKNGYTTPKPLIEIKGKPFFFWAVMSVAKFVNLADITFVTLRQHIDDFGIDREFFRLFPEAKLIVLPEILPGSVYTCIEGVKEINDGAPIIFNDCDHMFMASRVNNMLNAKTLDVDGALLTFSSTDPQFSYVRFDAMGNVEGTVEKSVVSNQAICGAYIFRNKRVFLNAASKYIINCPYSECYMSGVYNVLCEEGKRVKAYPVNFHVEFGTPHEYEVAKESRYFSIFI